MPNGPSCAGLPPAVEALADEPRGGAGRADEGLVEPNLEGDAPPPREAQRERKHIEPAPRPHQERGLNCPVSHAAEAPGGVEFLQKIGPFFDPLDEAIAEDSDTACRGHRPEDSTPHPWCQCHRHFRLIFARGGGGLR